MAGEVCWCELASLLAGNSVAPAVASALGRDDAEVDPAAAAAEALAGGNLLLVLDNCEHVLDACAEGVCEVTRRRAGGQARARHEPRAAGGRGRAGVRSAPSTPRPWTCSPTGRDWRPGTSAVGRGAADVALSASGSTACPSPWSSRPRGFARCSPAEIVQRLDHRFELLTRPRTRGSARHRTLPCHRGLRGARLLDEPERLVFERLSVVTWQVDAEAARALCGGAGVDAAAVLRRARPARGAITGDRAERRRGHALRDARDALTVARDRLSDRGELEQIRDRHADWYALLADRHAADAGATGR